MTFRTTAIMVISVFVSLMMIAPAVAGGAVPVFVSIQPQKYFVQQIGKDLVDARVMVKPGASPATYEPMPGQMAALSRARAYFAIGVPFEGAWLKKIAGANPDMRVVHTDHGIQKLPMAVHRHPADPGDPHGDHPGDGHGVRGIPDPHVWLSPPLVMMQARLILTTLETIDPAHRAGYRANYKAFIAKIADLDAELRDIFSQRKGMQFMVFHPSWGYFAHTYGLRQVPVEREGKSPKPARLVDLVTHARKAGIRVVFVQPQFSSRSAGLIAGEINGEVVVADPLALDWAANLRRVAGQFNTALR